MSQAFSARESGCFSCPARSSGLGPAALSDPPEGTPLQRKAFPEGFHRAGAEPAGNEVGGAVGGQGVAAAPGPVPQPAMLQVAVLGKENWKTNVPDPQPELGGVPGGGQRSELEAPPREVSLRPAGAPGLTWLGAKLKASPPAWFTGTTQCPSAGPAFGNWSPAAPAARRPCSRRRSIARPCHLPGVPQPGLPLPLPCPSSAQNWKGFEPWALLAGSFPAFSPREDPPAP